MLETCDCGRETELLEESLDIWRSCGESFPALGRQFTESEQLEREALFDECLDTIQTASFQIPETESERNTAHEQVTSALARLGACALDLQDPYVELLLRDGFSAVGSHLARSARKIDSSVSFADIFQACRNAWTTGGLQLLLGRRLQLTPAIFGYSMLYPYSDNYLDQPSVSHIEKLEFSSRFRKRLAGETLRPANSLEAAVWQFVGLIESQYPRAEYPQVYHSLLAIHHAQELSMAQLRHTPLSSDAKDEIDVVRLSFLKGGTSVLADAYLAAGVLGSSEARFAFEWGVFLQLGDDLQDLYDDLERGSVTLFTRASGRQPLDALTNRSLHFSEHVMTRMADLPAASQILKDLLKRSSRSILIRAAAAAGGFYTQAYLAELETYSPVRFAFLRARQEQFAARYAWFGKFFEVLVLDKDPDASPLSPPDSSDDSLTLEHSLNSMF